MERIWLSKNGQVQGPWSLAQVQQRIAEGHYALHDLAWMAPMPTWKPIAEVLNDLETVGAADTHTPPPVPPPSVDPVCQDWLSQRVRPSPWRRYWARALDFWLVGVLCAAIFIPAIDVSGKSLWYGAGVFSTLLLCAYDVVCMRYFQTTFGKWVLGIHVRRADGGFLTPEQSMLRAWQVCAVGYAFGLPLFSFVAQCIAYAYLRRPEGAWWDRRGDFQVFYEPRVLLMQVVWAGVVGLLALLVLGVVLARQVLQGGMF